MDIKDFLGLNVTTPINADKLNSSFKFFRNKFEGLTPEQQCFATVFIEASVIKTPGNYKKFAGRHLNILTWTSLGYPSPTIDFKADANSLYRPIFSGISGPEFISVGYQDFNDLRITTTLWDIYASQFTSQGYLIKKKADDLAKVTYSFFSFYDDPLKDTTKSENLLWNIAFEGVIFKEPQASGFSPSLGNLSRSFQFTYNRISIQTPPPPATNLRGRASVGELLPV